MTQPQKDPAARLIALKEIVISGNVRKTFDDERQKRLNESVAAVGILQALVGREVDRGKVELVAGARRLAAAKASRLESVPIRVLDLSDVEVLEVQLIENLQRDDLHPLEEADAYRKLVKLGGSPKGIAARIGKSDAYVYQRLRLCDLAKPVQKAFREGRMPLSVALIVSRIPRQDLQEQALAAIVNGDYCMDTRNAEQYVDQHFTLRLELAPFDPADAGLLPAAGACAACPKRTGNQKSLFESLVNDDTCMDPTCFKAKGDADWKRSCAEAERRGWTVLDATKAAKVFPAGYTMPREDAGFLDLNQRCVDDPKQRTWKQLIGTREISLVLARDGRGGAHKLVKRGDALRLLKEEGVAVARKIEQQELQNAEADEIEKRLRSQRDNKLRVSRQIRHRVIEMAGKGTWAVEEWRCIARALIERISPTDLAVRHGKLAGKDVRAREAIEWLQKRCSSMAQRELQQLVTEIALGQTSLSDPDDRHLKELATCYDIKFSTVAKELKADADARAEDPNQD